MRCCIQKINGMNKMSFCIFIFSVGFLCIIRQINGHSHDEILASYRAYAPHSDFSLTKVNLVPYSVESINTNSDDIPPEIKKDFEPVFQSYNNYPQQNQRRRRSYNNSNRAQNRRLNSTGRVDNFKTHEIYNTNLLRARNNATWNKNFKNQSVHCCNNSNLQRRRQEGMFLNTTAPVRKTNSSHYFNNGSLFQRNNRTYSSNSYNYQQNNRSHPYRINNTSLNNRWYRKKRSQPNNHYEETLAFYRSYASHGDSNITKVNLDPNSVESTYSDEIPPEIKKDFELVFQSYNSYQQQNQRSRRSYNIFNRAQNRRLNSTGRVDNFKTHEIYNTNLLRARNNGTWSKNFKNQSVHCCNNSNLQRRRQEGMFLNTTAPVRKTNSSHYFNNGSLFQRNNRTYSSNFYNYQQNNRSNPYRINNTSLNNRWYRKKRSQPNNHYNTFNYINQKQLSKLHQVQGKYSKFRHIKKRELKNNLVVEDNSKYTLALLKKLTTPSILSNTKRLKINRVFKYDEVEKMRPLSQFTTLSTESEPHDDTVLIQVPPRRIHCDPPTKLANGRCRNVW